MFLKKTLNIIIYLSVVSIFIGCGNDSSGSHFQRKVNCPKLKDDIAHQQKNVDNTRGRYYSSILFTNKKCISTKECIELRKKQEAFFVNKLESLESKYQEECSSK